MNNNSEGPTTKRPRQLRSSQKASQGARQKCKSGKSAQRVYFKVSFTKQKEQLLHLLLHRLTLFVKSLLCVYAIAIEQKLKRSNVIRIECFQEGGKCKHDDMKMQKHGGRSSSHRFVWTSSSKSGLSRSRARSSHSSALVNQGGENVAKMWR